MNRSSGLFLLTGPFSLTRSGPFYPTLEWPFSPDPNTLKKEFLIQEIYAKLTLYNFASFIKGTLKTYEHKSKAGYKYVYNHTQLLKICIRFLLGTVKNVAELVRRNVVPVRLGRGFERNLRRQSADSLNYR